MAEIDDANTFLEARNKAAWLALPDATKLGLLADAGDFLSAFYVTIVPDAEETLTYQHGKFLLAAAFVDAPFAAHNVSPITSKEERLEGVVQEKTTYAVSADADPYPLVSGWLSSVAVRKSSGFRVVQLSK